MFWIAFLLVFLPTVCSLATKCDKMDVTMVWLDDSGNSIGSITLGMEIINHQNGDTAVNVSELLIDPPDGYEDFDFLCQELSDDQACIKLTNNSGLIFPATNQTILFSVMFFNFGRYMTDWIFNATVDGGSFSMTNRSLFSPTQNIYTMSNVPNPMDFRATRRTITFQCKSLKPAPESQGVVPRCNAFQSKTTIMDALDNYKVLSTGKATYQMFANKALAYVEATVDFTLDDYFFKNTQCDCQTYPNYPANCTFTFTYDDSKFLFGFFFLTQYKAPTGYDNIKTSTMIIGRIINRNGQTLMEEGRPYTPQDNCIYFSHILTRDLIMKPLKGKYAVTNEFCCTGFELMF